MVRFDEMTGRDLKVDGGRARASSEGSTHAVKGDEIIVSEPAEILDTDTSQGHCLGSVNWPIGYVVEEKLLRSREVE